MCVRGNFGLHKSGKSAKVPIEKRYTALNLAAFTGIFTFEYRDSMRQLILGIMKVFIQKYLRVQSRKWY